jgi:hypothetical protein
VLNANAQSGDGEVLQPWTRNIALVVTFRQGDFRNFNNACPSANLLLACFHASYARIKRAGIMGAVKKESG